MWKPNVCGSAYDHYTEGAGTSSTGGAEECRTFLALPQDRLQGAPVPPEADLPIVGIGKRPTVVSDVALTPLSLTCETL
jgi:putative N-acetylmannosamine-6-phosphate epimerase